MIKEKGGHWQEESSHSARGGNTEVLEKSGDSRDNDSLTLGVRSRYTHWTVTVTVDNGEGSGATGAGRKEEKKERKGEWELSTRKLQWKPINYATGSKAKR